MKSSTELRKELKAALRRERIEKLSKNGGRKHPHENWVPDPSLLSADQIIQLRAARTVKGMNRQRLASWGVPWPPPPNWKGKLIAAGEKFHQISNLKEQAAKLRKIERIHAIETRPTFAPPDRKVFKKHQPNNQP